MRLLLSALMILTAACGLTVTNERPPYEELDTHEQDAVDVILQELERFNAEVKSRISPYHIEEILDRERVNVSFEGLIFTWNFGDNTVHVAVWENLSGAQRELIQTWFQATAEEARDKYAKLFYEFMAVAQGAKQFMYNALTSEWVFGHRTLFSIEVDSIETALAHYEAIGLKEEMWSFTEQLCEPVIEQYDATFGPDYSKEYFSKNFRILASPEDPTGYMYYICRWIQWSKADLIEYNFNLTKMLYWIEDLPN